MERAASSPPMPSNALELAANLVYSNGLLAVVVIVTKVIVCWENLECAFPPSGHSDEASIRLPCRRIRSTAERVKLRCTRQMKDTTIWTQASERRDNKRDQGEGEATGRGDTNRNSNCAISWNNPLFSSVYGF